MTQPTIRAIALAVPLLLHGILRAQQAPDTASRIAAAQTAFAALHVEDGKLIGAGRDFRARFDQQGVHFVPALGERAATEHPVTLRGIAYGRGAADRTLPEAAPSHRDRTVAYARGDVTETWDVRNDGLKQSFVFHQRPVGEGDLVVAVQIDTDLAFAPVDDDAVKFTNELGGVRIGGVLGIDAAGRQARGSLAREGSSLLLRLPAAFVDDAALPLVLDPVIGATFTVANSGQSLDPDVAYDAGSNKFLVVWWQRYSATTADAYGQFVHNTQTGGAELFGTSVVLRSGANSQRVRVGNCSARDAFVVGWQDVVSATPPHRDVYVRALSSTSTGTQLSVATTSTDENAIEIAGDTTETNGSVVIAWLNNGNANVRRVNVSTGLTCSLGTATAVTTGGTTAAVRLTQNGGIDDRYLVGTTTTAGVASLRAYSGTGTLAQIGATLTIPAAAAVPDIAIDGNGSRWPVAWAVRESASSTNFDIQVAVYAWNNTTSSLVQDIAGQTFAQSGVNEVRPSIAVVDHTFALTYVVSAATSELRLRTFGLYNCTRCESEITLATSTATLGAAIASQASVREIGLHRKEALIVWQADTGTTSPVSAVRWTADAGITTTAGIACGGLTATAVAQCAVQGASGHLAVLTNAPAGALCWLVVSPDRRDATGCGSCVLVPDLWNAVIEGGVTPDSLGVVAVSLPIASSSFLIGYRFYEQWLVADATSPGCPAFAFDFSNALQVQIQ
jgi:hypothetical protein